MRAASIALPGSIREVDNEAAPADAHRAHIVRRDLAAAETSEELDFELPLKMRHFEELSARIAQGEIISDAEMSAQYRPLAAAYATVLAWVQAQGLTVDSSSDSTGLFGHGTVAQLAQAFQTTFARVGYEGAEYTSAIAAPSLPSDVADAVVGVNGLQPHLRMHRHVKKLAAVTGQSLSSYSAPYLPRQILAAYGGGALTNTGSGQVIAIIGETTPTSSDLTAFWSAVGSVQTLANVTTIQVVSGTLPSVSTDAGTEATLDVEWAGALAPAATIRVYATVDGSTVHFDKAYAQLVKDVASYSGLRQASISYGTPEATGESSSQIRTDDQYFAQLAAAGVTITVSSGDGGSSPDSNGDYSATATAQVEFPASDSNVTAVGGTSLVLNSTTGAISSETAWSDGGGGASIYVSRPSWQTGSGVASGSTRLVPDVAAAADPNQGAYIYWNGQAVAVGGTSWGAPLWAGFCALINQGRVAAGSSSLGPLGVRLYPLLGAASFHDITSGSNGAYQAGAGYDEVTGLGSPNLAYLVPALGGGLTTSVTPTVIAPQITAQPASLTVAIGAAASFAVTATGTAPLTYQWSHAGTAISGATSATYAIAAAQSANAGSYTVTVTNSAGSVTSAAATLTVALVAPQITAQPASTTVSLGSAASFAVTATGTAPLTYQWSHAGAAIAGATAATFSIAAVTASEAGAYTVTVTNAAGAVTSSAATLTITVIAPQITAQPASSAVAWGSAASFAVTATGSAPLTFQWSHGGSAIAGATAATYSIAAAQASDAGTYAVTVTNAAGAVTSAAATLAVNLAPVVVTAPASTVIADGASGTISVAATGPGLTYEWQYNGVAIAGATSATLSLSQLSTAQEGVYSVVISNSSGSVTVATTLTVQVTSRLVNISSRAAVDPNHPLAAGFVLTGTGEKQILLRGIGPGLAQFGITDALATPSVDLYSSAGAVIAANTSWGGGAALAALFARVGAFPLIATSADSALSGALVPGTYTAEISGQGNTGIALAELYDEDGTTATTQLINLSSRSGVGTGEDALVAGFVVSGTSSETVLLRGVGPALATFGISDAVAAPILTVYDASGNTLATSQGWNASLAAIFTRVGAFALPTGSADCAVMLNLAPGSYTVQMTSAAAGTGMVEIYSVP